MSGCYFFISVWLCYFFIYVYIYIYIYIYMCFSPSLFLYVIRQLVMSFVRYVVRYAFMYGPFVVRSVAMFPALSFFIIS